MKKMNNGKVLRYVVAYNDILNMILGGIYPAESKLPSEMELSEHFGISRMTLRQALLLLQEDGYIQMRHGSGSYVRRNPQNEHAGLEEKSNPIYKCCSKSLELKDVKCAVSDSYDFVTETFGREVPWVEVVERIYYAEGMPAAYAFTLIPSDSMGTYFVDAQIEEAMKEFIERQVYKIGHTTRIEIRFVKGNDLLKVHGIQVSSNQYILITETIHDHMGIIIQFNKFYIPDIYGKIKIHTK